MANNPVQIVLNSGNFINDWNRPPGGSKRDFFEGKDAEFAAHKHRIAQQLTLLEDKFSESDLYDVTYAKLMLVPSALAKTHRPTKALFKKEKAPVVGGGDLGELFVEVRRDNIHELVGKVLSAENETRRKEDKDGKMKANPSQIRSEVGAIESIQEYGPSDKRNFSVSEGLEWLSNPKTGSAYVIELFETPPRRQDLDLVPQYKQKLFSSFEEGLKSFKEGIVASRLLDSGNSTPMLGIRVEESSAPVRVQFQPTQSSVKNQKREIIKADLEPNKHASLIDFLDKHPLVKKISLPPIIQKSVSEGIKIGNAFTIPSPVLGKRYPKVAIVDGGVSSILNEWIEVQYDFLHPDDKDEAHGTFIAGILSCGNTINGPEICKELDGCKIIDLDLLPKEEYFQSYYNNTPLEFFKELRLAVEQVKEQSGVRIFNFSLNIQEHVSSDGYSRAAKMLDSIAEELDVIFVISAGNIHYNDLRREWTVDPTDSLASLAASRNDTLKVPAESCRNLSVAALNPPNLSGIVPYAPSVYSCRGPGIRVGIKPDLAHIGGCGSGHVNGTGLMSINSKGDIVDGCGTSYAAPNVAKTLACIDNEIEGYTSRETLMALAIHQTTLPEVLQHKKLKSIVKNVVGFGIPSSSSEVLQGSDSSITLVFANRIKAGKKMSFKFTWPPSLVLNGKCKGRARLTLVSTPPFDYNYGAEFARVNIEAYLRQEHITEEGSSFKGRLESLYPSEKGEKQLKERNLIEHAFKWASTKGYAKEWPLGVGNTSNWALEVEYLARDGETIPIEGIPFTVMLTIDDPKGEKPVFKEMHQMLKALGVQIADIQTAARVSTRI